VRPRVLFVATCRWVSTARLAKAFSAVGCDTAVLCPRRHPATTIGSIGLIRRYQTLTPLRSIRLAIDAVRPDIVIPADDVATTQLQRLYCQTAGVDGSTSGIGALLRRSFGDAGALMSVTARATLMDVARHEGVRVPPTAIVGTAADLTAWLDAHGSPAVLKTDGSSGGLGVRVVRSAAEARQAWRALSSPPRLRHALKRAVARDFSALLAWTARNRPVVNAQAFVSGTDANYAVACWEGRVLAGIAARVISTTHRHGPASVIELIENREMSTAVERVVSRLRLSGLVGFDFILDDQNGSAWLIEMNPRSTQTAHLPLGPGRNLPASIHAVLSGQHGLETPSVTQKNVIALFPNAWTQDPSSEILRNAYHDIPWGEVDLVRSCLDDATLWSGRSPARITAVSLYLPARMTNRWRTARASSVSDEDAGIVPERSNKVGASI